MHPAGVPPFEPKARKMKSDCGASRLHAWRITWLKPRYPPGVSLTKGLVTFRQGQSDFVRDLRSRCGTPAGLLLFVMFEKKTEGAETASFPVRLRNAIFLGLLRFLAPFKSGLKRVKPGEKIVLQ